MSLLPGARVASVTPSAATDGGRLTVIGDGFDISGPALPDVRIGDVPARVSAARASRLTVAVPPGLPGGTLPVTVAGADGHALLQVGRVVTEGLHQVDSPAFDAQGRCTSPTAGRAGSRCRCRCSASTATAGASRW